MSIFMKMLDKAKAEAAKRKRDDEDARLRAEAAWLEKEKATAKNRIFDLKANIISAAKAGKSCLRIAIFDIHNESDRVYLTVPRTYVGARLTVDHLKGRYAFLYEMLEKLGLRITIDKNYNINNGNSWFEFWVHW